MEEKKLTDEELVGEFEHFVKYGLCREQIKLVDILDIIKRQKAEIKRLTEERDVAGYKNGTLIFDKSNLQAKNAELQKQVDELNRKFFHCHADALETCPKVEQAVKNTAKEILDGLSEMKERVKSFYGAAETVGADIAIRVVKEIFKQKGVEVEYKRLTKRGEDYVFDNCCNCEYDNNPQGCTEHLCYEVMKDRLAELEDKIEQGTLKDIPEGALVLTREEWDKYQETQRDWNAIYFEGIDQTRKETAEKFAEMAKERKIEMGTDGHSYCMVFVDDIDEICKEITEGK